MKIISISVALIASLLLPACKEEPPTAPASPETFTLAAASAIHGLETGNFRAADGFLSQAAADATTPLTQQVQSVDLLSDARTLAAELKFYWTQMAVALEYRLFGGLDLDTNPDDTVYSQRTFSVPGGLELTAILSEDLHETWLLKIRDTRDDLTVSLDGRFEFNQLPSVTTLGDGEMLLGLRNAPVEIWVAGTISDGVTTLELSESSEPMMVFPEGLELLGDLSDSGAWEVLYNYRLPTGLSFARSFTVNHPSGLLYEGELTAISGPTDFTIPELDHAEGADRLPPPEQLYLSVAKLEDFRAHRRGRYTFENCSAASAEKLKFGADPQPFTLDFIADGGTLVRTDPGPDPLPIQTETYFELPGHLRIDGRFKQISTTDASIQSLTLAGDLGTLEVTGIIDLGAGLDRRVTKQLQVEDISGNQLVYRSDGSGELLAADGSQVGEIIDGEILIGGASVTELPPLH